MNGDLVQDRSPARRSSLGTAPRPRVLPGLLLACALGPLLRPVAAPGQTIAAAVVTVGEADKAAAAEFSGIVDAAVVLRRPGAPRDTDAVMGQAGREWPEAYVVVFDVADAVVRVLRPQDGLVLYRPLDADVARNSPYTAALAAAELLDLAVTTPLARIAAVPPPPATERRPVPPCWALGLAAGGTSVVGLAGDLALVQPVVAIELLLDRRRSDWFGALSLAGALAGLQQRNLPERIGIGPRAATLDRDDLILQATLGRGIGPAALLLSLELGFAFTRFTVREPTGAVLDRARRAAGWLGLTAAVRLDLGAGFFLQAGTGVAWAPESRPFVQGSDPVFDAGAFQLRGHLAVGWDSA